MKPVVVDRYDQPKMTRNTTSRGKENFMTQPAPININNCKLSERNDEVCDGCDEFDRFMNLF